MPDDRRAARVLHDSYLGAVSDGLVSFDPDEFVMTRSAPLDDEAVESFLMRGLEMIQGSSDEES